MTFILSSYFALNMIVIGTVLPAVYLFVYFRRDKSGCKKGLHGVISERKRGRASAAGAERL